MKRFFKPVEKDGSTAPKKPCLSPEKRDGDGDAVEEGKKQKEPTKFVTWNANSFLLRVKNDWSEFSKFVSDFDPDVIAVQVISSSAYQVDSDKCALIWLGSKNACCWWKGKPKNYGELSDDTKALREEKQILMRALSSPPFGNYRVWWSLAESKYAGTALLVKKCFKPLKVYFNLDKLASKHEPDGRVILAEFETFRLLNTYSPNNGWKEEENSFQRRRKWDKRIVEFLSQTSEKPLIWCGDLNVSHEEIDVSHPEFFATAKLNGYVPQTTRTADNLDLHHLREHASEPDMESGFSWSGNPIGKYRGKRMRIDYFLVSEQLKDRIVCCKMHGRGIELEGFYGSDHCPVSLELSKPSSDSEEKQVSN
ncbi:hypothetical protein Bca52824_000811 [Brassica carinata]|uniref:DNA-(apurinic or apyrimidinic site) endonuclease n=1 Tax=Brassica carinata TaxID=52824 RepID=A0A8X7WHC6_BRACI|nr:hypothetical protein Bca52824_000811 [Brassica carinata]